MREYVKQYVKFYDESMALAQKIATLQAERQVLQGHMDDIAKDLQRAINVDCDYKVYQVDKHVILLVNFDHVKILPMEAI